MVHMSFIATVVSMVALYFVGRALWGAWLQARERYRRRQIEQQEWDRRDGQGQTSCERMWEWLRAEEPRLFDERSDAD